MKKLGQNPNPYRRPYTSCNGKRYGQNLEFRRNVFLSMIVPGLFQTYRSFAEPLSVRIIGKFIQIEFRVRKIPRARPDDRAGSLSRFHQYGLPAPG